MPLLPAPEDIVAVHEATSEFEAIAIRDLLEAAGIRTMIRSRFLPASEIPEMWGDKAGVIAEILVRPEDEAAARALIAEYLASLETEETSS